MTEPSAASDQLLAALQASATVHAGIDLPGSTSVDIEGMARFASVETCEPTGQRALIVGVGSHWDENQDVGYVTVPIGSLPGLEPLGEAKWSLRYEIGGATFWLRVEAAEAQGGIASSRSRRCEVPESNQPAPALQRDALDQSDRRKRADMTFERMISIIAGWIGRTVAVRVEDGAASTVVMTVQGQLRAASVDDTTTGDGGVTVAIGDEGACDLVLERFAFNGADGDDSSIDIVLGDAYVRMAPLQAAIG